uniref:Reverse transcriptase domain-containing protein n=1 Tax=Tanacetum cinerariifolium TaxID=118510 RepID=A0A6L2P6M3_TANCI|nr:reverse transcriptase domain-containing protein [Tanacetum cinerariifolium]
MKANDAILKNMQTNMTSLTNSNLELKNMFSQFIKMNTASSLGLRTLPGNTITNPKEDLKGITTKSGTAYQGPMIPTTSSSPMVVECETEATKDTVRATNNGSTKDVQPLVVQTESPILNSKPVVAPIIEPVIAPVSASKPNQRPSIPFADALILMPKFGPTIKTLLTNKDKLSELARTSLNKHCSAVLLKKLPKKLGDLGKFLIPCDFPKMAECLALADLGASINLMSLSVWNKLSLPELTPTLMTLELADRSISRPIGVAEDVFVKVGKFHFPADFVVVDFDADPRVPLILGRYFHKTGRALIDVSEALVNAYECDKIILETYGDTVTLKRRHDDEDKDEEPSARSDRGSKRRRAGKEPESTSAPKEKASKTSGKSTKRSKSHQNTASESAPVEEPIQTTQDLEEPSHKEFETCAFDDQPVAEASQHPEWFQKQTKPPTPDRAWNKTLPATHGNIQPWISDLAKQADSRTSFNELMDTHVDFSAFLMNRLKVDTLTPELLAGPIYELMKRSCKSLVEFEFFFDKVYKATTDQLDWNTPEGHQYPHNMLKPPPLIPKSRGHHVIPFEHFINNDLKYLCGGASSRKYTNSVTKTKAADYGHIKWIEFLGIQMKYLPQTIWRRSDKERATSMIQAIDKQLKTRRTMRSLEKFVGGRLYEGDFRMLQRTI